jgi:hypothetical protein
MNKFRPKILDYDTLVEDGDTNKILSTTFAAAEKCFGLEQYLEVSDVALLDSKSMLIYVSEYYMGAADMRKVDFDLAVRRITKLVAYTRTNDDLKKNYIEIAVPLRSRIDDALPG